MEEILIHYWRIYHVSYANNLGRYEALLKEKRRLGVHPLYTIPRNVLRDYPKIHFLGIESETEMRKYLGNCNHAQMVRIRAQVEDLKTNYVFNTVKAFIEDAEVQIKRKQSGFCKRNLLPLAEGRQPRGIRHAKGILNED